MGALSDEKPVTQNNVGREGRWIRKASIRERLTEE